MTSSKQFLSRRLMLGSILTILLVSLAGCGDKEVATEPTTVPVEVSPGASNQEPAQAEEATLDIRDGEFSNAELILQKGDPTILEVVNHDDTPYQLRIEGLVSAQSIAASDTTQIEFTTPTADTYTGQLLGADDSKVLDEISVVVEAPSGNVP